MKNKLSALIEVRKIIAFITVAVFVILALKGSLQTDFIQNVVLMVIAFYFAKSTALDGGDK
ncbi:MAG: hypothetical protein ABS942_17425 [Solibacillus sp.]|uniref:hypothetical protein n=1 Tax=Solibacillus sp. TaxID=1909654 RepID=UPI003315E7DD